MKKYCIVCFGGFNAVLEYTRSKDTKNGGIRRYFNCRLVAVILFGYRLGYDIKLTNNFFYIYDLDGGLYTGYKRCKHYYYTDMHNGEVPREYEFETDDDLMLYLNIEYGDKQIIQPSKGELIFNLSSSYYGMSYENKK